MRKQLLILFSILFISFSAVCQDWQWVKEAGGTNFSESKSIATDANGNSYVVGNFANSITIGNVNLTGSPNGSTFVAKYDSNGGLVWAKALAGTSVMESMDIASDATGNTYLTGNFKGTVTLGAYTLTSPEDRSAFVVKLDQSGSVVWAKQAGSIDGDVKGLNITVDVNGNAYVTGNFFKSATFGSTTIKATKDEQLFIAKYSSRGDVSWVKMAGGLGSCFTHDITTDKNGNLYLAGQFWLTAVFGSTTLSNYSEVTKPADIFIAKYDPNGNAVWAKQAGGTDGNDVATGITVDESGNSYITGYFQNRATFESATITGNASGNIFLAKYSATGSLQWLKKQESSGDARAVSIDRDADGNLYIAGHFEGSLTFDNTALVASGSYDIFFIKYSPIVTVLGAIQAGGIGLDLVRRLQVNGNGGIYFTGQFEGPAAFGPATLERDIVVGKLNSVSMPKPAPTITTGNLKTTVICTGATIEVPFSTVGQFGADNVFTVQLSNSYGSFAYPTEIGSGAASPITVTIPSGVTTGPGYRIRVVASSPKVNGTSNATSLTVNNPPMVTAVAAARTIEVGASTNLYASGADAYEWFPATGLSDPNSASPVAKPSVTTTYTVTGTRNGCSSTATVTVRVEPGSVAGNAFAWSSVQSAENTGRSFGKVTVADAEGNIYVAGEFTNSIKLGSATLTVDDGSRQTFFVKYNPEGQVVWAKQLKGNLTDMALDAQGNVYLVGSFVGTVMLGEYTLRAVDGANFYVVKYSAAGTVVWATQTSGLHYSISSIAVSPAGELYLAGPFSGVTTFNEVALTGGAYKEFFLVKYSVHGKALWGKAIKGTSGKNYEMDLAADVEGAVYMTSSVSVGTLEFNSLVLTNSKGGPNAFVAKYRSDGQFQWAKLVNQNQEEYSETFGSFIGVDKNKNVYLQGRFNRHTRFETGPPLTAVIAGTNGFLAKYDTEGNFKWVTETGGSFAAATAMTIDPKDNIYVTGSFRYTARFGTKQFVIGSLQLNKTDHGVYVARYDVDGNTVWAEKAVTPRANDLLSRGISVDVKQNIFIAGHIDITGNHEPVTFGCQVVRNTSPENYFLAKLRPVAGPPPVIKVGKVESSVCTGVTLSVPFTVENVSAGCSNYFVILSDDKGSFDNAEIIGTGTQSPIMATIPARTFPGSGYRVNVISSGPAATGMENGAGIAVTGQPKVSIVEVKGGACTGNAEIIYSVQSTATITSYTWAVPEGWVIIEGQGSNSIRVRSGKHGGEVAVTVEGVCNSTLTTKLTVSPPPSYIPVVTPVYTACGAGSVVLTADGAPAGATYRWYTSASSGKPIWENSPQAGSASRFQTSVIDATTTFYVSILPLNGCEGEKVAIQVIVKPMIEKPGPITASVAKFCSGANVTYQVAPVKDATGYQWSVPDGWAITSGQGTTSINVRIGAVSGSVTVVAFNTCGASPQQALAVEVGRPVIPAVTDGTRCGPGSVTLQASGAPAKGSFNWYASVVGGTPIATGGTFITPALTATATYYVAAVTEGGCESPRTAVTATIVTEMKAEAGRDETVCFSTKSFALTGYSPVGGKWSGPGVSINGVFDPSVAGVGVHELRYTFDNLAGCSVSDTKVITVREAPVVTLADFEALCSTVQHYVLSGGQPAGGVYSGLGVKNGLFTPVDSIRSYPITYTYTNAAGCAIEVTKMLTVTTCTGIAESKLATKLTVYPIPTKDNIYVELPLETASSLTLTLYDTRGQTVLEQRYPKVHGEFRQVLSLRNRAKGVYMLQLVLEDGVITRRVVLE